MNFAFSAVSTAIKTAMPCQAFCSLNFWINYRRRFCTGSSNQSDRNEFDGPRPKALDIRLILPSAEPASGTSKPRSKIIARNVHGYVYSFWPTCGYGFIRRFDTQEDVFVWYRDIRTKNPAHAVRSLLKGEHVQFDILQEKPGRISAVNVTGPNFKPVQGDAEICDFVMRRKQQRVTSRSAKEERPSNCSRSTADDDLSRRDLQIIAKRVRGVVKWYNSKLRHGCIRLFDSEKTLPVYFRNILRPNPEHSEPSLAAGECVEFDVVRGPKGEDAVNVTGPYGACLTGDANFSKRVNRRLIAEEFQARAKVILPREKFDPENRFQGEFYQTPFWSIYDRRLELWAKEPWAFLEEFCPKLKSPEQSGPGHATDVAGNSCPEANSFESTDDSDNFE